MKAAATNIWMGLIGRAVQSYAYISIRSARQISEETLFHYSKQSYRHLKILKGNIFLLKLSIFRDFEEQISKPKNILEIHSSTSRAVEAPLSKSRGLEPLPFSGGDAPGHDNYYIEFADGF